MTSDSDLHNVLRNDGVAYVRSGEYVENQPAVNINSLANLASGKPSWAFRVALNESFGAVVILQQPGEGNRLHYHPNADELWVILQGSYVWEMEQKDGSFIQYVVAAGDVVVVTKGRKHKITATGKVPAVRIAITKPNVEHVYAESDSTDNR